MNDFYWICSLLYVFISLIAMLQKTIGGLISLTLHLDEQFLTIMHRRYIRF